jgi:peptidoglycan/xylan/chitin deacetylase (PgdA/CDA1 family)
MKKILLIFLSFCLLPIKANLSILDINLKTVALSFDDGPSTYTKSIINLLDKYGYNATFFVVGNKIENNINVIKKISEKNEIGNHTYNHIWATHYSNDYVNDEINKTDNLIYKYTKQKTNFFRPSYGAINNKIINAIDKTVVLWTLDSSDWKIHNSNKIAEYVLKNVKDNDIILMHDTYKRTYDALKIILPELKKRKYQVVSISTLYKIRELRSYEN